MTANIGALTASLGLDSAAFIRDLGKASQAVASNTAQINKALKTVSTTTKEVSESFEKMRTGAEALIAGLAVEKFVEFGKSALESATAIEELQEKTGLTTKAIQELQFAASQSGLSSEAMSTAIERLTVNVGKAKDGTGTLSEVAKRLGLDLSSPQKALESVADAVEKAGSESTKAQILVAAFGKEGVKLAPLFAEGAAGLAEMGIRAEDLGTILGDDLLKSAKAAEDHLAALELVFQKTFDAAIIKGFAGAVTGSTSDMERAAAAGKSMGESVGAGLKLAADGVRLLADNMKLLNAAFTAFVGFKAAGYVIALAGAFEEWIASIRAAVVAQGLLNAVVAAFPIARVASLLVSGAALLYEFRDATITVGDETARVGNIVSAIWTTIAAPIIGVTKNLWDMSVALLKVMSFDFAGAESRWADAGKDVGNIFRQIGDAWSDLTGKGLTDPMTQTAEQMKQFVSDAAKMFAEGGEGSDSLGLKVGDLIDKLKLENTALQNVHDAFQQGAAAANDAAIANEVFAKLAALGVKVTQEQHDAVLALVAANHELTTSVNVDKTVAGLQSQNTELTKMFGAAQQGVKSVQAVNDQMQIMTALGGPLVQHTQEEIDSVTKWVIANNALVRSIQEVTAVREAQHDADIAAMQADAAGLYSDEERRRADLIIERQREINTLIDQYGSTTEGAGAKILASFDAQAASQEKIVKATQERTVATAQQDAAVAAMTANSAGLFSDEERRKAEVIIDRYAKVTELTREYGTTAKGVGADLLASYDAQAASLEKVVQATQARDVLAAQQSAGLAQMQASSAGAIGEDAQRAADAAIDRQRELNALMLEYGTTSEGAAAKILAAYDAQAAAQDIAFKKTRDTQAAVEELSGFTSQTFDTIGSAITSMFDKGSDQAVKFGDVMKSIATDILNEFTKLAVVNPLMNALFGQNNATLSGVGGVIGGLLGGLFGGGDSGAAGAAEGFAFAHTGGLVGGTSFMTRPVSPSVFSGAPRLHNGLRSDEIPAILQKGETVIPRGGKGGGDQYFIDARGSDKEGYQQLARQIAVLNGSIEKRSVDAVVNARKRNPALLGSR